MSLRIRRGTDAQRLTLTFDQGEVVYTTDTKKVYIGDGVTAGGTNILATSAGTGVTFNATTQAFDFTTSNLGLTTSVVSEGANKYFTTQRAQDAAAALFTAVGSPATTGTIVGTVATGTVTLSATPSPLLEQGEKFTVIGTGGGGLTAGGTYFVISNTGTSVILASSLANAMTSTAITSLSTASLTGTTFSSAGISTGITFTYDSVTHTLTANSTGLTSLVTDSSPSLGGNLNLNSRNITGAGTISTSGDIGTTGNISVTTGNISTSQLVINTNNISSSTGYMYIGKNSAPTNLVITGDPAVDVAVTVKSILSGTAGLTQLGPIIRTSTSKGTLASPLVLGAGDSLGQINFQGLINAGSFGAVLADVVSIKGVVATAGDLISNIATGRMELIVLNGPDPTLAKVATFDSVGVFKAPVFQLTTYASDAARTTAIPTPAAGMMVFMSAGTSPAVTNKAVIYNGSAWAVLPG
jgi:hypothetical protein